MRVEQAMAVLEELLDNDSSDDDCPPPPSPKRKNSKGWHLRRGCWHPEARQNPAAQGKAKWNHDWSKGFIYRLLQRVENDESGYWDGVHRARLGGRRAGVFYLDRSRKRFPPEGRGWRGGLAYS